MSKLKQQRKRRLLLNLPWYWSLLGFQREQLRRQVRALERRRDVHYAENILGEWLYDSVEACVASELPFSLSTPPEQVRDLAAELYGDDPAYQHNPRRFLKVFQRAYRGVCHFWRLNRSLSG